MKSILSYPERGPYGKSSWRGNTSGYVIKDLIGHFQPKLFVDVCEGSGTSRDVCKELNINYVGLDLHSGHDFTKMDVLSRLPRPADICFSHPPYHDMIKYSGAVYGNSPLNGDISRCSSVNEFLDMAQIMLNNQRQATTDGGIYTSLIGDMRKDGKFHSFQADFINMMPASELISVVIKMQHNCVSDNRTYTGKFIPILHEYLLIWRKSDKTVFNMNLEVLRASQANIKRTWKTLVKMALMKLGGKASLTDIYNTVDVMGKAETNNNITAKIRQVLQTYSDFKRIESGVWAIA